MTLTFIYPQAHSEEDILNLITDGYYSPGGVATGTVVSSHLAW
jgi:hypothetical protein